MIAYIRHIKKIGQAFFIVAETSKIPQITPFFDVESLVKEAGIKYVCSQTMFTVLQIPLSLLENSYKSKQKIESEVFLVKGSITFKAKLLS